MWPISAFGSIDGAARAAVVSVTCSARVRTVSHGAAYRSRPAVAVDVSHCFSTAHFTALSTVRRCPWMMTAAADVLRRYVGSR